MRAAPSPAQPTAPGSDEQIRAALWSTIPVALATETGAIAEIAFGGLAGVGAALVAVLAFHYVADRVLPTPTRVRVGLLVGGPPLRYGLVIVATWYESSVRNSGPIPALAAALVLVIVIPMVGAILTAARARRAESNG